MTISPIPPTASANADAGSMKTESARVLVTIFMMFSNKMQATWKRGFIGPTYGCCVLSNGLFHVFLNVQAAFWTVWWLWKQPAFFNFVETAFSGCLKAETACVRDAHTLPCAGYACWHKAAARSFQPCGSSSGSLSCQFKGGFMGFRLMCFMC